MKDHQPLFSIIIPSYNYAHSLGRAIESTLCQVGNDYELVIIDDGSTDNTADVVSGLQLKYPSRIAYYTQENGGPATARNRGIDMSTGRYLVFLDADDALTDSALQLFRDSINLQPATGMIIGGHWSVSQHGTDEQKRYRSPGILPADSLSRLQAYLLDKSLVIAHGACAMRRDVFDRYRYPALFRSSEDIPVFAYILANFSVCTINKPIAKIYLHTDSLRHNVDHARTIGDSLVNEVFSPDRMSGALQILKKPFHIQRNLSLSRTFFIAGDHKAGYLLFIAALKLNWRVLFKWSYSGKAIRAFLKSRKDNTKKERALAARSCPRKE